MVVFIIMYINIAGAVSIFLSENRMDKEDGSVLFLEKQW